MHTCQRPPQQRAFHYGLWAEASLPLLSPPPLPPLPDPPRDPCTPLLAKQGLQGREHRVDCLYVTHVVCVRDRLFGRKGCGRVQGRDIPYPTPQFFPTLPLGREGLADDRHELFDERIAVVLGVQTVGHTSQEAGVAVGRVIAALCCTLLVVALQVAVQHGQQRRPLSLSLFL
jgi:hypothetical protein